MNSNDRANLIKRINTLEGLTDKERCALLGLLRENKTYGLVWEDKPEDVEERLRDELPILTEVPERAIISEDKDAPNHILIEGDNLEALATLAYTHEGKIDIIYIDPPYNTGNKDFIYNDSYVDKEDSYRHSKWLSFMSRRLKIAKKLLSDRGVIFISIDDNELAQLRLICDEIFSNKNLVGCIPRLTSPQRFAQEKNINISHDYLLVYRKYDNISFNKIILNKESNGKELKRDKIGYYYEGDTKALIAPLSQGYSANCDYDFEYNGKVYKPINKDGTRNRWFWTQKRMEIAAQLGILRETKSSIRMQIYQDVKFDVTTNTLVPKEIGVRFCSLDLLANKYSNPNGMADLSNMGNIIFNNPKPINLIKTLCELYPSKFATILDFFAGSGTTLHAAMQLNAEDGGHRQCILVTNNENNICETVTYKRNRRVIQGYTNSKGEEVAGLTKNNLRYYRTGFVGRSRSMQNMRKLVNLATDMLCVKENLYTEQNTFGGQKTYKGVFRYFDDGKKQMLVIYREEAINELVDIIYDMDISQPIKVYVFSPSEDPWEGSFDDVSDKVELCALPQAIYNTYRRILPKKKDAVVMPEEDALASTQEDKDLFEGMLNFTDEEEA